MQRAKPVPVSEHTCQTCQVKIWKYRSGLDAGSTWYIHGETGDDAIVATVTLDETPRVPYFLTYCSRKCYDAYPPQKAKNNLITFWRW